MAEVLTRMPTPIINSTVSLTLLGAVSCCSPVPGYVKQQTNYTGASQSSTITSKALWNDTGILLSKGKIYRVNFTGSWTDWIVCYDSNGPISPILRSIMKCMRSDLRYPPQRDPLAHFFQPVGFIGHPKGPEAPAGSFILREGMEFTSPDSGYLFVFANDHLDAYWNNSGSLGIMITSINILSPHLSSLKTAN